MGVYEAVKAGAVIGVQSSMGTAHVGECSRVLYGQSLRVMRALKTCVLKQRKTEWSYKTVGP